MELWFCLAGLAVGLIAGNIVTCIVKDKKDIRRHVGVLRMDRSDPDEAPYLFLELEPNGLEKINMNSTVLLKVNLENYISRK